MKSWGVDANLSPGREMEYSCLASLVPNGDGGVLGAALRNDSHLGLSQRSMMAAPESASLEHTGGNILKVSYKVLDGRKSNHHNGRSDEAPRCVRCDLVKFLEVVVILEM